MRNRERGEASVGYILILIMVLLVFTAVVTVILSDRINDVEQRVTKVERQSEIRTSSTMVERSPEPERPVMLVEPPAFEVPGLAEAIAYWNGLAGYPLLVEAPEGHVTFSLGVPESCGPYSGCALRGGAVPPTPAFPSCVVHLSAYGASLSGTVAHEFGHCFGLAHTDGGIMADAEFHPEVDSALIARVVAR